MIKGDRVRIKNFDKLQLSMVDFNSFHRIKTEGGTVKRIHGGGLKKYFGLNEDNSTIEGTVLWARMVENAGVQWSSGEPTGKKEARVEWDNGYKNRFWQGNLEVI